MSEDQEREDLGHAGECYKHQVIDWRKRVVNRFLPDTDCDRDDIGAVGDLIESLQSERDEARDKASDLHTRMTKAELQVRDMERRVLPLVDTGDCGTCDFYMGGPVGGCSRGQDTKRASCCYHSQAAKNDKLKRREAEYQQMRWQLMDSKRFRERDALEILASIWFYGDWKWETHAEKELEEKMRAFGLWPTTESEIIARTLAREGEEVLCECTECGTTRKQVIRRNAWICPSCDETYLLFEVEQD